MSDRMSVAEAREWLPMAESHDVNANISRLLRTAISQAEQIERLHAALSEAARNWYDALSSEYEYTCKPEGFISTYESLRPADMEPPA